MSDTKRKLMVIDGNALIHRSFHALPPTLTTKKGEMVNAVYGFTAVLLKAIREFRPDYIALTLDRGAPTFRHKEYKEYKANRVKAPDELYGQIPRVKEIARAFNIPIYEKDGFEADDLIGTISRTVDGDVEKIIVTGDLDTLQLINEHTKVYTMKRGLTDAVLYDEKAVKQRYGLKPEQMIDFKALRGDPSDNIPGVRGIGEKTAVELLKNFKTLDNVYKNISSEKIKSRVRDLLSRHKEDALMSKKLAAIDCAVKISFKLEEARFSGFDREKAARLFSELEFKSLLPRLQSISAKHQDKMPKEQQEQFAADKFERNLKLFKYYLVDNKKDFEKFFIKLAKVKEFAFDTETAGLDSISAELLGMSFSWKAGEAYYVRIKNYELRITNEKKNLF
ncbi:MAG: 5'-3' exonuclease H3TH domain-containing protein, partial [Candidatus Methanoperedens sp.]|nr:5'-3' exonuclease H3TH domain-containing protein [Candidatus Methanoperedens sp.]